MQTFSIRNCKQEEVWFVYWRSIRSKQEYYSKVENNLEFYVCDHLHWKKIVRVIDLVWNWTTYTCKQQKRDRVEKLSIDDQFGCGMVNTSAFQVKLEDKLTRKISIQQKTKGILDIFYRQRNSSTFRRNLFIQTKR